jgi:hypothetical protein
MFSVYVIQLIVNDTIVFVWLVLLGTTTLILLL